MNAVSSEQQIDHLMGCAVHLFPPIGRLTDLIRRVRQRTEKRNSPAIISKALEIQRVIEAWTPTVDVDTSETSDINIADLVQMAEAYRWAAFLLLRQTVPELPWSHSLWELARKTLVFLATVSVESHVTIVQIFPLLAAGGEVIDEEDREFVRERWDYMSQRIHHGTIDRCKKLTEEVWRRRDEFAKTDEFYHAYRAKDWQDVFQPSTKRAPRPRSSYSDFPDSAAFRKGIDLLTRAGSIRYMVKGSLHWLEVMREWEWEVLLG